MVYCPSIYCVLILVVYTYNNGTSTVVVREKCFLPIQIRLDLSLTERFYDLSRERYIAAERGTCSSRERGREGGRRG